MTAGVKPYSPTVAGPHPLPRAAARGREPSRIMRNIPLLTHPQQTIRRFNRRIHEPVIGDQ